MSSWGNLLLQEGASSLIESILLFHDYIIIFLSSILFFVGWLFFYILSTRKINKYLIDLHILELIWTLVPILILLFIAYPSLYLLYLTESQPATSITVKVIAHQWYWEYQYDTASNNKTFDSYINQPSSFGLRNLDVDNRIAIPSHLNSLLLISSADVLHCFTVPMLGVKVDAVPGRLNYLTLSPNQAGIFYGQCRELCGRNHSYIPIVVESISPADIINYMNISS